MQPVIHLSEGIMQHISNSSLARWEEMTLLTVNYSQPISPLRCCGLFISDLTLLDFAPLLVWESSASAPFEADAPAPKQQKAGPTFNVMIKAITYFLYSHIRMRGCGFELLGTTKVFAAEFLTHSGPRRRVSQSAGGIPASVLLEVA